MNLRERTSMAAPIELLIPNRARVQASAPPLRGADGYQWYRVVYQNRVGYARAAFLQRQMPASVIALRVAGAARGFTGANLRPRPSAQAPILALIPNGARVEDRRSRGRRWTELVTGALSGPERLCPQLPARPLASATRSASDEDKCRAMSSVRARR